MADNSSAELIAGNEDLLTLILLRLPLTSLIEFKSVSKQWRSIISDHRFALLRNPNLSPSGMLMVVPSFYIGGQDFDFIHLDLNHYEDEQGKSLNLINDRLVIETRSRFLNGPAIQIIQSCNGLVLCCSSFIYWDQTRPCFVCNLATKQINVLPRFRSNAKKSDFPFNLAFDPLRSQYYKVICVEKIGPIVKHMIWIYSSETRNWRISCEYSDSDIDFHCSVFWNNTVHWIHRHGNFLLIFDLEKERLQKVSMLPIQSWEFWSYKYFGNHNNHLHLIEVNKSNSATKELIVYEMPKDYSGWFVKYRVDLAPVVKVVYPYMFPTLHSMIDMGKFCVICVVREEVDVDSYVLIHIFGKVIRYNFNEKSFKITCDITDCGHYVENRMCIKCYHSHQYVETLFHV